jgi:hypothetical protein
MMKRTRATTESLTIEEIAAMTDAEAVRRQFDASNTRIMSMLTSLLFIASIPLLIHALSRSREPHIPPVAILTFVFGIVTAAFYGELAWFEKRRGKKKARLPVHLMQENLSAWIVWTFLIGFALLSSVRGPRDPVWIACSVIFPWALVLVRLPVSRRALLHAAFMGMAILNVRILGSSDRTGIADFFGLGVMSLFAFAIGALISRRVRLSTLDEWSERRTYAKEQLRMRDELRYAREVQLSMLPESAPSLEWLDIAGASLPATEVGGDYYDYFPEENAIALVCGDVAGHGLASGIVLASLRSGFTLLRHSLNEPVAVLQKLNDLVAQTSRRRMLATAAVVLLDRTSGVATIASAGHPPVMVRRNGIVDTVELFAPPLGVRLPFNITSTTMPFGEGDVFVLHSDGVYEAQNADGEVYGFERLARTIASADGTAASVRDTILRDVELFRGATAQADDVTVVVARVVL